MGWEQKMGMGRRLGQNTQGWGGERNEPRQNGVGTEKGYRHGVGMWMISNTMSLVNCYV